MTSNRLDKLLTDTKIKEKRIGEPSLKLKWRKIDEMEWNTTNAPYIIVLAQSPVFYLAYPNHKSKAFGYFKTLTEAKKACQSDWEFLYAP